jgi:predicted secreted hydrolase
MRKLLLASGVVIPLVVLVYWALPGLHSQDAAQSGPSEPDLMSVVAEISAEGFERPSPEWILQLPADHAAHGASRTESWQLVSHLKTEDDEELGIQFLFLRVGLAPPTEGPPGSIWDFRELERGHVTLVDANSAAAIGEERFGRGIPGLSGYDGDTGELQLDNWSLRFGSDGTGPKMTLYATIGDTTRLELAMRPEKMAVPLEPDGADAPFVGYSLTRLSVQGTVDRGQGEEAVAGSAWFDHLWGELPVPGTGPVAWDRLQLQLEGGTDISLIRTRRTDGRGAPVVNGIMLSPDGAVSSLHEETIEMTASRTWRHPSTEAAYPIEWRIVAPELDLSIEPVSDAQAHDFSASLWSGLVRVQGYRAGTPVSGVGTLQLTGYGAQ